MDKFERLDKSAKLYIKWAPRLALTFVIVALSFYVIPRAEFPITTDPNYWGTFGDFLGGTLNPLFGVLTLLGLMLTVWLQMETLDVQRKELKTSNEELAKSTEALAIQNKTMLAQNFEGTFFQMLRRHNELLENLEFQSIAPTATRGLRAINEILSIIARRRRNYLDAYLGVYDRSNSSLGPYFRNLYHLIKLIDKNQNLTDADRADYASLARAQLSSSELSLIFYNCLTDYGQGLKPLVIKYRLLKHIDGNQLCDPNLVNDANLYPLETYQARN
jgi:hypothetical protein